MDNYPISSHLLGRLYQVDGKQLGQQYKDHLSDFHSWDQKEHAEDWMLFADNIGPYLSIDETALSNGELYTIVTNKQAKGNKKAIVAMIKGTGSERIIAALEKIPLRSRNKVKEVTMDMAANMIKAIRRCFNYAVRVVDRFHVQKLAYDAVQEARIKYRWEALDAESELIEQARKNKQPYQPEVFSNGDTLKQLLARSRYLLFKHRSKWTLSQKERADLLFSMYPELLKAYNLAIGLGKIFTTCKTKVIAFKKLAIWYNDVETANIDAFKTVARSVHQHYESILNFFDNRSTNASAESFNAKVKAFRATLRGVRDTSFFLFRLAKV
ncbi:transposase [Mucilaginibacter rubeus]|uniref:Transposase n=1 Tax=Mucilaginibacter rubeus TaxID=2027860 RepID=A0AAE6MGU7_9SPHI|nr:transposase [Mucilaginibacter rubeus]QEM15235.1 transposase [Mucilaginibacter gossypii]QTE42041.1 transposase [Mucilaginibacter rubeus]QTE48642.1 transposase [Mucilaginibacter rubeus]QTE60028.1 transposase [Mucilaginibacter rubeus]